MVSFSGAVVLGLGSILGTGIFVSVGIAAGVAGAGVLLAIPLAALVAILSGLSSAQLAAVHPVSGGTYEYGYRFLGPLAGFLAGWTFLAAKSASAATAALGAAGYVLTASGGGGGHGTVALALGWVLALTLLVAGGMRGSIRVNAVIVSVTLAGLLCFVVAGLPRLAGAGSGPWSGPEAPPTPAQVLHATALLFVAYTGYGRVATLGEEVRDPARTIPRAIVVTLLLTTAVYAAVTVVALGVAGPGALARATRSQAAPLEVVARAFAAPGVAAMVGVAAVTAMTGVLLNLVLGLSRVVLAMGRRGDLPRALAGVDARRSSPVRAVVLVGGAVAALVVVGNVETTWSFSAFTVLVYYALTNLAALRIPPEERRYGRWVPALGLASCLGLAFWVEPRIWGAGLALLAAGVAWHLVARGIATR